MSISYYQIVIRDLERDRDQDARTINEQQTYIDALQAEVLSLTKKLASCRKYWEQND